MFVTVRRTTLCVISGEANTNTSRIFYCTPQITSKILCIRIITHFVGGYRRKYNIMFNVNIMSPRDGVL